MKMENLLLFGALGLGAYLLFSKRVSPKPLTQPLANQYYPGMQAPLQLGAPACPPGYSLEQSIFGNTCRPVPTQMPGGTAPVIVKASEDVVYVDGKLVPVSEIFG